MLVAEECGWDPFNASFGILGSGAQDLRQRVSIVPPMDHMFLFGQCKLACRNLTEPKLCSCRSRASLPEIPGLYGGRDPTDSCHERHISGLNTTVKSHVPSRPLVSTPTPWLIIGIGLHDEPNRGLPHIRPPETSVHSWCIRPLASDLVYNNPFINSSY